MSWGPLCGRDATRPGSAVPVTWCAGCLVLKRLRALDYEGGYCPLSPLQVPLASPFQAAAASMVCALALLESCEHVYSVGARVCVSVPRELARVERIFTTTIIVPHFITIIRLNSILN